jgi:hypothetical protein
MGVDATYLAGLWDIPRTRHGSDLVVQLDLWWHTTLGSTTTPVERTHDKPKQYRAPTWLWASVNGPITKAIPTASSSIDMEILVAGTCTKGHPLSLVLDGYPVAAGRLCKLGLRRDICWIEQPVFSPFICVRLLERV